MYTYLWETYNGDTACFLDILSASYSYDAFIDIILCPLFVLFYIGICKMTNFWDQIMIENIVNLKNESSNLTKEDEEMISYSYYSTLVLS